MADDYLVMHRVMMREWEKWAKEHISPNDIGHTLIRANDAYKDGFMAGFLLKFTKGED